MKFYKVRAISILFSAEPAREFTVRYFTVMYFLENSKVIYMNYMQNAQNLKTGCRLPKKIHLDETTVENLPTGVPTNFSNTPGVSIEIN